MTHDELVKLAKEDAARVTLLSLEKARLDQSDLIYQARKEGYDIGFKIGIEIGEALTKMILSLDKQGVDINIIATAARMSTEEVLEILNNQ